MCGDGTNDVGALKHANVGVALLTNASLAPPEPIKLVKRNEQMINNGNINQIRNKIHRRSNEKFNASNLRQQQVMTRAEKFQEAQKHIQKMFQEIEEQEKAQIVKLGDASIAAPFTSKLSYIQCGNVSFFFFY